MNGVCVPHRIGSDGVSVRCIGKHGRPVGMIYAGKGGTVGFGLGAGDDEQDFLLRVAANDAGIPLGSGVGYPMHESDADVLMGDDPDELAGFFDVLKKAAAKVGQGAKAALGVVTGIGGKPAVQATIGPVKVDLTDPASRKKALDALKAAVGSVGVQISLPPASPAAASMASPAAAFQAISRHPLFLPALGGLVALALLRRRRR